MSIDRSLKVKGALARHRNVLTRAERIERLKDDERWSEGDSLSGLPKVSHRKTHASKKAKGPKAEAEKKFYKMIAHCALTSEKEIIIETNQVISAVYLFNYAYTSSPNNVSGELFIICTSAN